MIISCFCFPLQPSTQKPEQDLVASLNDAGVPIRNVKAGELPDIGICIASGLAPALHVLLRSLRERAMKEIFLVVAPNVAIHTEEAWSLLQSGASDILMWTDAPTIARALKLRIERRKSIETNLSSRIGGEIVLGRSAAWRDALGQIVEIAQFGKNTTLILGESGTGKEVAAKLIHDLDGRTGKRNLVVQDCSTLVPELSGSEFFGHEKGAFTGAHTDRQGAFALAHGGTLFLDEIGELPLPIQAQLLRAIQEGTYKRVGGSIWHRANFRLICATNRDLAAMVSRGEFRADLYHRIAGHICRLPPLRERLEDILPLALSFVQQMSPGKAPTLDPMVREFLLRRAYPGNIRELKQVVGRLMHRCGGDGTISIGLVDPEERLLPDTDAGRWVDAGLESVVQRAVVLGAGLKEIGRAAEDCAIRCAMAVEDGSLKRAALRLGVTDRALQLRRAQGRADSNGSTSDGSGLAH